METEQEVLVAIGERLKKLRVDNGYTSYEQFAIKNELSRMQYWRMEMGKSNITIKTLLKVLAIHKIKLEDFFKIQIDSK